MRIKLRLLIVSLLVVAVGSITFDPAAGPAEAGANQMFISQTCQADGTVSVTFTWYGGDPNARQQWVSTSLEPSWFPWRDWTIGPYSAATNQATWHGFPQNVRHYVHVSEQHANGAWEWSQFWNFVTKTCGEQCHESYTGPGVCLKPDSGDYDCWNNGNPTGNGPNFTGRVQVVGPDVFGLDSDGDGIGCERG